MPAEYVGFAKLERRQFAILDADQHAALGAGFARAAPLGIARVDDVGPLMQDLIIVNVAQGPVVISFGDELLDGTGSVGVVVGVAAGVSVQQPDVEAVG